MTMLKATTIHWHNKDDIPSNGYYLVHFNETNSFATLEVFNGHWNCSEYCLEHEMKIDAWAELPDMED